MPPPLAPCQGPMSHGGGERPWGRENQRRWQSAHLGGLAPGGIPKGARENGGIAQWPFLKMKSPRRDRKLKARQKREKAAGLPMAASVRAPVLPEANLTIISHEIKAFFALSQHIAIGRRGNRPCFFPLFDRYLSVLRRIPAKRRRFRRL